MAELCSTAHPHRGTATTVRGPCSTASCPTVSTGSSRSRVCGPCSLAQCARKAPHRRVPERPPTQSIDAAIGTSEALRLNHNHGRPDSSLQHLSATNLQPGKSLTERYHVAISYPRAVSLPAQRYSSAGLQPNRYEDRADVKAVWADSDGRLRREPSQSSSSARLRVAFNSRAPRCDSYSPCCLLLTLRHRLIFQRLTHDRNSTIVKSVSTRRRRHDFGASWS